MYEKNLQFCTLIPNFTVLIVMASLMKKIRINDSAPKSSYVMEHVIEYSKKYSKAQIYLHSIMINTQYIFLKHLKNNSAYTMLMVS